jgi:hypothetical protein
MIGLDTHLLYFCQEKIQIQDMSIFFYIWIYESVVTAVLTYFSKKKRQL